MSNEYFVSQNSIVRKIWGRGDTILFIFAGASAEFALSKSVDWLYFTGRLPADPLGRLFSTVSYARSIVFSEKQAALRAIDSMTAIHAHVEEQRGTKIPNDAYRDVIFLLIDYSIRAFEILERQLTRAEKNDVVKVFFDIGERMGIDDLPLSLHEFESMRENSLNKNLDRSNYTDDLFLQYRRHLGSARFRILIETQMILVPLPVRKLLEFRSGVSLMHPVIVLYKLSRFVALDSFLKSLVLPSKYIKQVAALDNSSLVYN